MAISVTVWKITEITMAVRGKQDVNDTVLMWKGLSSPKLKHNQRWGENIATYTTWKGIELICEFTNCLKKHCFVFSLAEFCFLVIFRGQNVLTQIMGTNSTTSVATSVNQDCTQKQKFYLLIVMQIISYFSFIFLMFRGCILKTWAINKCPE